MGMDWTALANTISGIGQGMTPAGQAAGGVNAQMNQMFQAQAQQQALKKAKEEEEKKEKSGKLGKIGSALGTIGGVALAPFTGGASLLVPAAMGAAGSAVGGAAGRAIGGGGFDLAQTGMDAAMGGIGGLGAGMLGGFGNAGQAAYNAAGNVGAAVPATPVGMAKAGVNSMLNPAAALGGITGQQKKAPRLVRLPDGSLVYTEDATQSAY